MVVPALVVILLDQTTKAIIIGTLRLHDSVAVIKGFFNLVHVRNRGMAFGIMNQSHPDAAFWFLTAASFVAIGLLLFWFFHLQDRDARMTLGLSLILGGAVGNLIDRVRFREVVDFLDLFWGAYHWPAFNVADAAITVGTGWVAFSLIFRRSPAE
jgi:signal peptidase II